MQWVLIDRIGHIAFYVLTKISGSNKATKVTQNVKHFSTIKTVDATIDSDPAAISGWTTDGWREDDSAAGKTIDSRGTVSMSGDKTIYAVYRRTATFYSGVNKAKSSTANQYYNTQNKYSVQTPSTVTAITGWTNKNWVTSGGADVAFGAKYTDTSNVFYAKYSRTANFYHGINKAQNITATQIYTSNDVYALTTPAISKAAAIGNGWNVVDWYQITEAKHYNGSVNYNGKQNTFYAYYKRSISIKYDANGGSGTTAATSANQYYNSSNSISPSTLTLAANKFTRTGYNFSKWDLGNVGADVTFAVGVAATKTAKAQWTGYNYTVTYKQGAANTGWSATTYANQSSNYPTAIKIRTNSMGRNTTKKSEYTITFNANGGSVSPTSASTYIPVAYTKNGWSTASAGTTQNYKDGASYSRSDKDNTTLTLYPCFKSADQTRTTIKMPTPTKTNMSCTGWWTATSGGTKVFSCGVSYGDTIKNSQTVYAQWTNATANIGTGSTTFEAHNYLKSVGHYDTHYGYYLMQYQVKFQLLAGKTWQNMIDDDTYKWPIYFNYTYKDVYDSSRSSGSGKYTTRAQIQAAAVDDNTIGSFGAKPSNICLKARKLGNVMTTDGQSGGTASYTWTPKFKTFTTNPCVFFNPYGQPSQLEWYTNLGAFGTSDSATKCDRVNTSTHYIYPTDPLEASKTIALSTVNSKGYYILSDATGTEKGLVDNVKMIAL